MHASEAGTLHEILSWLKCRWLKAFNPHKIQTATPKHSEQIENLAARNNNNNAANAR